MKNKVLLFTFCMGFATQGFAQAQLELDYDPAGNQIQRQFCIGDCELAPENPGSKTETSSAVAPIAEDFDDTVVMYPNPTSGTLRLHWDTQLRGVVQQLLLIDFQGRVVQKMGVDQLQETTLDLSSYPSGSYFVKFVFTDQSIHTRKIIKK